MIYYLLFIGFIVGKLGIIYGILGVILSALVII